MPKLTEYPVLLKQSETVLREAQAIGWNDDTTTAPTRQHVAVLTMELELTRRELAQAVRVAAVLSAAAMPLPDDEPVKVVRPC